MRSAVLQFLLAGALVVAWIWMLGRPLLTMLARRTRRDSVGHFRSQQAALGRTVGLDRPDPWMTVVLRPFANWRSQPLEQRRLQVLLGGAIATFASVLLAIALRGVYVRLFLLMVVGFGAHLLVAAWIGARELRRRDAEMRRRTIDQATSRSVGRSVSVGVAETAEPHTDEGEVDDLLTHDGLSGGTFDEGFFEPIPELDPQSGRRPAAEDPMSDFADDQAAASERPAAGGADRTDPTFTNPVTPRPRPGQRPKGRPIYVEPEIDEDDASIRAVND